MSSKHMPQAAHFREQHRQRFQKRAQQHHTERIPWGDRAQFMLTRQEIRFVEWLRAHLGTDQIVDKVWGEIDSGHRDLSLKE